MELHQMFLDMAVLVEAQGEMLDNIQKQVGVLWVCGGGGPGTGRAGCCFVSRVHVVWGGVLAGWHTGATQIWVHKNMVLAAATTAAR
jgi:hypothetical protein